MPGMRRKSAPPAASPAAAPDPSLRDPYGMIEPFNGQAMLARREDAALIAIGRAAPEDAAARRRAAAPAFDPHLADSLLQPVTMNGYLDGLHPDGTVRGWASADPEETIRVELFEDGALIAAGLADQPRPDVAEAGMGNELSGFILPLPPHLFDGASHGFEVWVKASGLPARMLGLARGVLPRRPAPPPERSPERPPERSPDLPLERSPDLPPELWAESPAEAADIQHLDLRQEEIEHTLSGYLEDMLATALARVDELEQVERALHTECDTLRRQLAVLSERVARDARMLGAAPHRAAPGAFDGAAVRVLNVTRRRDAWLNELTSHGVSGPVFALGPHDGQPGPLAILVWGSGGIGDILYLTSVVRELARLFKDCALFVLHENGKVAEVLKANPYVAGTIWLEGTTLQSFVRTCHSLDIFDLIAEVRYAVTYSAPPLSRAPMDFLRPASYRAAEWQTYVRYRWPHLNNLFAREVMARGMAKLDLVGWTAMLPIDRHSPIDLFVDFADHVHYPELRGKPYVTIHHGADKKMAAVGGQQTKNLPLSTWNAVVPRLQAAGYAVVQLGEPHEELAAGVDHDFRGRTSLERTAYVLKTASAHLDTEGGIVHLARTVNTECVVAFGPTPAGFFGYPDNVNVEPPVCGSCWWTADTWSKQCPRGLPGPECMVAHSPDALAEATLGIAGRSQRRFMFAAVAAVPLGVATPIDEAALLAGLIAEQAAAGTAGAVVIGPSRRFGLLRGLDAVPGRLRLLVPADQYGAAQHALAHRAEVGAYAAGNVPLNSRSLDWVVAIGFHTGSHSTVSTLTDLARCLRPSDAPEPASGRLKFVLDSNERDRTAGQLARALIDTNDLRPGRRYLLQRGPATDAAALDRLPPARSYVFTIREIEPPARPAAALVALAGTP
jgi:ADP-heptose:LPS heptosyltransferase